MKKKPRKMKQLELPLNGHSFADQGTKSDDPVKTPSLGTWAMPSTSPDGNESKVSDQNHIYKYINFDDLPF